MTADGSIPHRERCWFCDGWIFRGDATRMVPGMGLRVHARCYEADTEPPSQPTNDE
jgi:hypothetical protein